MKSVIVDEEGGDMFPPVYLHPSLCASSRFSGRPSIRQQSASIVSQSCLLLNHHLYPNRCIRQSEGTRRPCTGETMMTDSSSTDSLTERRTNILINNQSKL